MSLMKSNKTKFQKIMTIMIPVIVLLLIAAIVMTFALAVLNVRPHMIAQAKNLTIIMALASALLAIAAIVFAVISKSGEPSEEDITEEVGKIIDSVK